MTDDTHLISMTVAAFKTAQDMASYQTEREIVAWLRNLAGYPASVLEGRPPHGEVWVLHRAAEAIERGEYRK